MITLTLQKYAKADIDLVLQYTGIENTHRQQRNIWHRYGAMIAGHVHGICQTYWWCYSWTKTHAVGSNDLFPLVRVLSLPPLLFPLPMAWSTWNASIHCTHHKPLWSSCQNSLMTHLPYQFVIGDMSLTVGTLNWTNNAEDEGEPHHFSSPPPETWLTDLLSR